MCFKPPDLDWISRISNIENRQALMRIREIDDIAVNGAIECRHTGQIPY